MVTTFDGSSGGGAHYASPEEVEPVSAMNALDLLRGKVKEAEELQFDPTTIEVPGDVGIRLICSSDIAGGTITKWQRAALPPNKRNSPKLSPLLLDQTYYSATVLIETCVEVQVRNAANEWTVITDASGDVLGFKDRALLDVLGSIDPRHAVKRLFRRDADIARAAQEVLAKAGWADDEDGDDDDPR